MAIPLRLCLGNGPCAPVVVFHGARDHGAKPTPIARCWGGSASCVPPEGSFCEGHKARRRPSPSSRTQDATRNRKSARRKIAVIFKAALVRRRERGLNASEQSRVCITPVCSSTHPLYWPKFATIVVTKMFVGCLPSSRTGEQNLRSPN